MFKVIAKLSNCCDVYLNFLLNVFKYIISIIIVSWKEQLINVGDMNYEVVDMVKHQLGISDQDCILVVIV